MPPILDLLRRWLRLHPTFNFGTGQGSLQRVLDAVNAALRAGDEAQMRAIYEHLDKVVARDEGHVLEANKPIYAGRMLGAYLNDKHRYIEAEAILTRVKMRKKATLSELVHARFALADAIWGQGDRQRAEKEALVWIEKLLNGRDPAWPNSQFFAKLAKYRYKFDAYAHYSELAFVDALDAKEQPRIEANRHDAKLHLQTALAWNEAGRNTPALEQLSQVWNCEPTEEQRLMALSLEFYWRASQGDKARAEEILEQARQLTQDGPTNANARRMVRLRANFAQSQGDLDQCEALLNSLGTEGEAIDAEQTLTSRAEVLVLRGEWENARRLYQQKGHLHPIRTRYGIRYLALTAMGVAYLELRANYCGATAYVANAEASLTRNATFMRGDRKILLWMEALQTALAAAQDRSEEATQRARAVAAQFDDWSDSPELQNALAPLLMGTYLRLQDAKKAVRWGEKALEIGQKPVYLVSHSETLANAYEALGDAARARQLREMVVASGYPTMAVALARQQLARS